MKKYNILFISFLSIFLLFSCGKQVEQKVETKKDNNVSQVEKKDENKKDFKLKKFNKDITKISFNELNNSLYSNGWWDNLKEKIKLLNSTWSTIDNKFKATFLESFLWDYKNALKNRYELCKKNNQSSYCEKKKLNLISYRPKDNNWNNISNVKIYIDWRDFWELKWKNSFELENKFIHRIKLSKEWYLDFYKKIFIDDFSNNLKDSINPKLLKADFLKEIDSTKENNIKSDNFEFNIKKNSFKTKSWKLYSWKVKLYIFDIGEQDWDINALNLDSFDDNWSYWWNSMVTFWMPLIKAYDTNWNELIINEKIIWKWKIQNINKASWINLNSVPKNKWLTKQELDKYNIPNFWHLDQENGVWIADKMKILDSEWNYEFNLY